MRSLQTTYLSASGKQPNAMTRTSRGSAAQSTCPDCMTGANLSVAHTNVALGRRNRVAFRHAERGLPRGPAQTSPIVALEDATPRTRDTDIPRIDTPPRRPTRHRRPAALRAERSPARSNDDFKGGTLRCPRPAVSQRAGVGAASCLLNEQPARRRPHRTQCTLRPSTCDSDRSESQAAPW